MDSKKDTVVPGDSWEFNEDVAAAFDDMLKRSIPSYAEMRDLTTRLAIDALPEQGGILNDLGSSRGEAVAKIIENKPTTDFILHEISDPMLAVLNERFRQNQNVFVKKSDLRTLTELPATKYGAQSDVVTAILTILFTPIEYRQQIIDVVYRGLKTGGVFLFVEKVLGSDHTINKLLVKQYYDFKLRNGYSYEDISRKKASLEGVQVPISVDWNIDMLRHAGFRHVDCYYRNLNFAGFIAIK